MTSTAAEPGLYLLNYDGDILTSYEVVTVNSDGLAEVSPDERPYLPADGDTLTPLALAPRVVLTVAELNALPDRSIVRTSPEGVAFERYWGTHWRGSNTGEIMLHEASELDDLLPATVLWVGGTE